MVNTTLITNANYATMHHDEPNCGDLIKCFCIMGPSVSYSPTKDDDTNASTNYFRLVLYERIVPPHQDLFEQKSEWMYYLENYYPFKRYGLNRLYPYEFD